MQNIKFVGYDGKKYDTAVPHEGVYEVRHDGRFWHITFPIEDDPGSQQIYRGRTPPHADDHDRWVRYRPYPPWMRRPAGR